MSNTDAMTTIRTAAFLQRIRDIGGFIDYRGENYQFTFGQDMEDVKNDRVFIQLQHYRPDVDKGTWAWGPGGKRYLSPHMTDSEIVRVFLGAALAYEEHEVREAFTYKGARIFGPHISVEAMVEIANRLDVRS